MALNTAEEVQLKSEISSGEITRAEMAWPQKCVRWKLGYGLHLVGQ